MPEDTRLRSIEALADEISKQHQRNLLRFQEVEEKTRLRFSAMETSIMNKLERLLTPNMGKQHINGDYQLPHSVATTTTSKQQQQQADNLKFRYGRQVTQFSKSGMDVTLSHSNQSSMCEHDVGMVMGMPNRGVFLRHEAFHSGRATQKENVKEVFATVESNIINRLEQLLGYSGKQQVEEHSIPDSIIDLGSVSKQQQETYTSQILFTKEEQNQCKIPLLAGRLRHNETITASTKESPNVNELSAELDVKWERNIRGVVLDGFTKFQPPDPGKECRLWVDEWKAHLEVRTHYLLPNYLHYHFTDDLHADVTHVVRLRGHPTIAHIFALDKKQDTYFEQQKYQNKSTYQTTQNSTTYHLPTPQPTLQAPKHWHWTPRYSRAMMDAGRTVWKREHVCTNPHTYKGSLDEEEQTGCVDTELLTQEAESDKLQVSLLDVNSLNSNGTLLLHRTGKKIFISILVGSSCWHYFIAPAQVEQAQLSHQLTEEWRAIIANGSHVTCHYIYAGLHMPLQHTLCVNGKVTHTLHYSDSSSLFKVFNNIFVLEIILWKVIMNGYVKMGLENAIMGIERKGTLLPKWFATYGLGNNVYVVGVARTPMGGCLSSPCFLQDAKLGSLAIEVTAHHHSKRPVMAFSFAINHDSKVALGSALAIVHTLLKQFKCVFVDSTGLPTACKHVKCIPLKLYNEVIDMEWSWIPWASTKLYSSCKLMGLAYEALYKPRIQNKIVAALSSVLADQGTTLLQDPHFALGLAPAHVHILWQFFQEPLKLEKLSLAAALFQTGSDGVHTRDGSVDVNGNSVRWSTTGNWKAGPYILSNECCERLAYYGFANPVSYLTNNLHQRNVVAARNVTTWQGTCYLIPVIGVVLADAYWRMFTTIAVFSIYLIATTTQYAIFLRVDQFDDTDPKEKVKKGSFFKWFYFKLKKYQLLQQHPNASHLTQEPYLLRIVLFYSSLFHCHFILTDLTNAKISFDSFLKWSPPFLLWKLMIKTYSKIGSLRVLLARMFNDHGKDALRLLHQMIATHVMPNEVTSIGVLKGCNHSGLIRRGLSIFKGLKGLWGIVPMTKHYGCYIDFLGRAALIENAIDMVKSMPINSDIVIWRYVHSSCRAHCYINIGEQILRNNDTFIDGTDFAIQGGKQSSEQETILVWEYIELGLIRDHICGSNLPSPYRTQQVDIGIGAALGLLYLRLPQHWPSSVRKLQGGVAIHCLLIFQIQILRTRLFLSGRDCHSLEGNDHWKSIEVRSSIKTPSLD